jgi:putative transcriptional regulator
MVHNIEVRIEKVLKERKRSLYWLSRNTGLSYTTLWRLTKERALGINFATLVKLCEALECRPGDIMDLTNAKEEHDAGQNKSRARSASSTV